MYSLAEVCGVVVGFAYGDISVDCDHTDEKEGGKCGESVRSRVDKTAEKGADGLVADVPQNGTHAQKDEKRKVQGTKQEIHNRDGENEKFTEMFPGWHLFVTTFD